MDSSGHSFYEFNFQSLRRPEDSLSVFSLLVNANSKLQNIKTGLDGPVLSIYIRVVADAVDLIFHVPEQVHNRALSPVPSIPSGHYPDMITPGSSTEPHGDGGDPQEQHPMDLDHPTSGVVEEDHTTLESIGFEESAYDLDEDDEPDTINGLTFSEMEIVLQRVSDGKISDRERADAAMLMLGMAGGQRSLLFIAPPSLSDAEHQAADVRKRFLRCSKTMHRQSASRV